MRYVGLTDDPEKSKAEHGNPPHWWQRRFDSEEQGRQWEKKMLAKSSYRGNENIAGFSYKEGETAQGWRYGFTYTITSLFKYVTIETLMKILSGGIRFTQPSAFNDPFELLPEICVPLDQVERRMPISFDLMAPRRTPPVGDIGDNTQGYNCCDIISRNILKDLNGSVGILCLSRISDSLLMWSHYADQYAGAVIRFDGTNAFFDGQIDVEYRSHRPRKDISAYVSEGVPIPIADLCVKPDQWKYENEVRVVRKLAECKNTGTSCHRHFPVYTQKVPQDCIKEIILGERSSVENQRKVWQAIKDTNISLSLAAVANWGYEFRKELVKLGKLPNPAISARTAHIFSHLPNGWGQAARIMIEKHALSEFVNNTV